MSTSQPAEVDDGKNLTISLEGRLSLAPSPYLLDRPYKWVNGV